MNMDKYTAYHYDNGVEKRTKEQLRNEYREVLFDAEIKKLQGNLFDDDLEFCNHLDDLDDDIPHALLSVNPERTIRQKIAKMERDDPVHFDGCFKRWIDTQGWLPRAGSVTESVAGTLVAGEVHS